MDQPSHFVGCRNLCSSSQNDRAVSQLRIRLNLESPSTTRLVEQGGIEGTIVRRYERYTRSKARMEKLAVNQQANQ